jgi:hypothetical protein
MTPKEKAKELVDKMFSLSYHLHAFPAKQCALIAVDEIIQLRKGYFDCINPMQDEKYWQEVKQEIEKL